MIRKYLFLSHTRRNQCNAASFSAAVQTKIKNGLTWKSLTCFYVDDEILGNISYDKECVLG